MVINQPVPIRLWTQGRPQFSRATHPKATNGALNGGLQMVEISRDGRRVYFTHSLYGAIGP
jgi:hypothetical protein